MTAPEPVAEMREQAAQAIEDEAHEHPGAEFHYSVAAGVVRALPLPAPVERVDLDAIEARARAATHQGPWGLGREDEGDALTVSSAIRGPWVTVAQVATSRADAAHIAGMDPTTTLRLVAELRGTLAERDASQRGAAEAYAEQMVAYNECARERDVWRDRAERRSQNYTDLGEAMGADPLDSHDGRVEMARLGRVARAEARDLRAVVEEARKTLALAHCTIEDMATGLAALSRVPAESPEPTPEEMAAKLSGCKIHAVGECPSPLYVARVQAIRAERARRGV